MSTVDMSNSARVKMIELVTALAGTRGRELAHLVSTAIGRTELQAYRLGDLLASLSHEGDRIEFGCYLGVHGMLYPAFALDDASFKRTANRQPITLEVVLGALQTCFKAADDVRLEDDREDIDPEVFVVDPAVEQELIEMQHT